MISTPLVDTAAGLLAFLGTHRIPACLIGGMVVSRWGEPRLTVDVDATVLADFGDESGITDLLLSRYRPREQDVRGFAAANRIVLLQADNGVDIDVSLAAFPFEHEVLDRSSMWQVTPEASLRTCSAEDLVLYKLIAARPIDIHDVQMLVSRQGARLDAERIRTWGGQFADLLERPELLDPFEAALKRPGRLR